tara:strand:+ start:11770 stop:12531 length:762 start_codon:yes stop_codon:yes gene_type:complete
LGGMIIEDESNKIILPIISAKNVVIGYDSKKPLFELEDFSVYPGEIIVLTGKSGIGKTTFLKTVAGLIKPISGHLQVLNYTKLGTDISNIKRGELGYIPQNLGLVRHATVMHNVMLGANARYKSFWHPFFSNDAKESAFTAIEGLGISEYKYKIVRKLSGGERRRVATARTLAQKPKLILADEFLSELDETTKSVVQNQVLNYISNSKASIIIVEHDLERAKQMSDRLFVISDGKLLELPPDNDSMFLKGGDK